MTDIIYVVIDDKQTRAFRLPRFSRASDALLSAALLAFERHAVAYA